MSAGRVRSGSSPTPNTPSTSSTATHDATPTRGFRGDEPVRPPDPRGPRPATGTGAVSVEKLGAATTQLLADWLTGYAATGGKVIFRPVLDLTDSRAVDQHDPPTALRELCILRDPHCVFPGCRRDSRSCDLDHIVAYIPMTDGGPPGQTNAENLAPLVPHPSPDQDPHRLGLQTPHRRHLHLDLPHRTPIRRHTGLPAPAPAKNLTPPHPGPPQPGTSARPTGSPIPWFRDARQGSLLNHRYSRERSQGSSTAATATTTVEPASRRA